MKEKGRRTKLLGIGAVTGFINSLLGAGGGILTVFLLRRIGYSQEESHATSVAVVLPLSLASLVSYLLSGRVEFSAVWPYLPWGAAGAAAGAVLLRKLPKRFLHIGFGAMILYAAWRLMTK